MANYLPFFDQDGKTQLGWQSEDGSDVVSMDYQLPAEAKITMPQTPAQPGQAMAAEMPKGPGAAQAPGTLPPLPELPSGFTWDEPTAGAPTGKHADHVA